MKKIILFVLLVSPSLVFAQGGLLKKLENRAKQKAEQRVVNKADQEIDKALDDVEGKKQPAKTEAPKEAPKTEEKEVKEETPTLTAYSKYDFVPGERIIYAEDFSQDEIGELPLNWNT